MAPQVLCGHHPYVEIELDILVVNAIIEGVRPEKPEGAASLGFTENLWRILEQCWVEDRSARPSVEDILPYLNDATLHWYTGTATLGNGGSGPISVQAQAQTQFSTQTGSPLTGAGGSGNGGWNPNDPSRFPSQQSTYTSLGPPSMCLLNGCNKRVFVDEVTRSSGEYYCSQRHRE